MESAQTRAVSLFPRKCSMSEPVLTRIRLYTVILRARALPRTHCMPSGPGQTLPRQGISAYYGTSVALLRSYRTSCVVVGLNYVCTYTLDPLGVSLAAVYRVPAGNTSLGICLVLYDCVMMVFSLVGW